MQSLSDIGLRGFGAIDVDMFAIVYLSARYSSLNRHTLLSSLLYAAGTLLVGQGFCKIKGSPFTTAREGLHESIPTTLTYREIEILFFHKSTLTDFGKQGCVNGF